jgi:hypothetical protein
MAGIEQRIEALEREAGMHEPRYMLLYTGGQG